MNLFNYMDKDKFPPEDSAGNIEYKSSLNSVSIQKLHKLATQMEWRLCQGMDLYNKKEAYYVIGIFDNGDFAINDMLVSENTLSVIFKVSEMCNALVEKIYVYKLNERIVHIVKIVSQEKDDFYPLI